MARSPYMVKGEDLQSERSWVRILVPDTRSYYSKASSYYMEKNKGIQMENIKKLQINYSDQNQTTTKDKPTVLKENR